MRYYDRTQDPKYSEKMLNVYEILSNCEVSIPHQKVEEIVTIITLLERDVAAVDTSHK